MAYSGGVGGTDLGMEAIGLFLVLHHPARFTEASPPVLYALCFAIFVFNLRKGNRTRY
jgi:hypothetical protein